MKSVFGMVILFSLITITAAYEIEFEIDPSSNQNGLPAAISKVIDEAFKLNKNGIDALNEKKYIEAIDLFSKAMTILPDYTDAENNKGVAYFRKGNVAEAQSIWEHLASKHPEYFIASYNLGLAYLYMGQGDASIRLFERALKYNKNFVEALVRLGRTYVDKGQTNQGLDYLKKAYKLNSSNPDAWSSLAYGYFRNGDTSECMAILKKNSNSPVALKMLAQIAKLQKKYDESAEYFKKAIEKTNDPELLLEFASVDLDNGNCKSSVTTIEKYFSMSTQPLADAYLTAGIASKECGNMTKSINYFEEGLKKFPKDPILRYNLGQLYFHQKKYDQSETVWSELADSVQDPSLYYLRAQNAAAKKEWNSAEKFVNRAIALDDRAEYHELLGVILYGKGNTKGASEQFTIATNKSPSLQSAKLRLALVSGTQENISKAIAESKKALESCTDDEECSDRAYELAVLYFHEKDYEKSALTIVKLKEIQKTERHYKHLALCYKELHKWEKAINALESAKKRLVLEPQTEYDLAESYLLAGYYIRAIDNFNALIPKWNQNPWRLYYQLGYAYLERNDLDKAKECFEKSLKSKSDNPASRALLAFVLNRQGKSAQAQELWQKNLKDDPTNATLWVNMGLALEKDEKYSLALEHYLKAISLTPDNKELYINVGNAYMGLNQYTDAFNSYSKALSSSKRESALYNCFLVSLKISNMEQADRMLNFLKSEFGRSIVTERAQAEFLIWKGDSTQALQKLENLPEKEASDWFSIAKIYAGKNQSQKVKNALSHVPNDNSWRNERLTLEAQLAFNEKEFAKALSILNQVNDTSCNAKYNIAVTAFHAKQYETTLRIGEKCIRTSSGNSRAEYCRLLGNACFMLKQWDKARQWYLQLSTMDARNAIVQYNLAVASYNLKEYDQAYKYYETARSLDQTIYNKDIEGRQGKSSGNNTGSMAANESDSVDIWYNNAVDLHTAGKDTIALELYNKITSKDPDYSRAWNNAGAIYGKWGQIDNAIISYQKAIQKIHDIPEVYANLVNLYIELEEFSKAKQWLIKGMGHNPDNEVLASLKGKIAEREAKVKK